MSDLSDSDVAGLNLAHISNLTVVDVPSPLPSVMEVVLPDECCARCKYFTHLSGQCHRFPPQVMLVYSDPDDPRNMQKTVWTCTWPNTQPELFCGEFKAVNMVPNK